jgi:hypothetical protein
MVNRVVLEIRDVTGNVDGCHRSQLNGPTVL